MPMSIVLASASPRRAELLRSVGLTFEVHPVDADETRLSGETAAAYVSRVASLKADIAVQRHSGAIVITADTTVAVDDDILGKPASRDDAALMLRRLSGRTHEVLTGVVLASGDRRVAFVETTTVWFTPLSDDDIAWYVASGEPMDKAGAYAIQGLAARFIPRIEGSYANVVGLPVATVCARLADFG